MGNMQILLFLAFMLSGCIIGIEKTPAMQPVPHGSADNLSMAGGTDYAQNYAHVILAGENGNISVIAEVASTPSQAKKGLMFRQGLESGKGMLFVFSSPSTYYFYMKNMQFPIDIIYIANESGTLKIMKIRENFQPCKSEPCELDVSPQKTSYALEVASGFASKNNIQNGSKVSISLQNS